MFGRFGMTFGDIASIIGLAATLFFGIWSGFRKPSKRHSKSGRLISVLAILIVGQIISTHWLGHPVIHDGLFSGFVMALVIGIFWVVRDEE